MLASDNGHTDIVKLLLESKADIGAKNKNNSTPLIIASDKGYKDIVKILEKAQEENKIMFKVEGASIEEVNGEYIMDGISKSGEQRFVNTSSKIWIFQAINLLNNERWYIARQNEYKSATCLYFKSGKIYNDLISEKKEWVAWNFGFGQNNFLYIDINI